MLTFLIVLYVITVGISLRGIYCVSGSLDEPESIALGMISLLPIFNMVIITLLAFDGYYADDFKLLRSKFVDKHQIIGRKPAKKLIKTLEPFPTTYTNYKITNVVTYKLANGSEVVERDELERYTPLFKYYVDKNNTELTKYTSMSSGLIKHVNDLELCTVFLNEVLDENHDPEQLNVQKPGEYYKKDFIAQDNEYFRVMSFKIDTEVEEVEIEYNNFRVVAREVEE